MEWSFSDREKAATYSLVVDDLNNGGELAVRWSTLDQDDTANFDQSPLRGFDVGVTHFEVSMRYCQLGIPSFRDSCISSRRIVIVTYVRVVVVGMFVVVVDDVANLQSDFERFD